jgi:hypothetical protein
MTGRRIERGNGRRSFLTVEVQERKRKPSEEHERDRIEARIELE